LVLCVAVIKKSVYSAGLFVTRAPCKRWDDSNITSKADVLEFFGTHEWEKGVIYSPMLYQLHRLTMILLVLVSPARLVAAIPLAIPAEAHATVVASAPAPSHVVFDTTQAQPVVAVTAPKPNFDTDVLAPLQADQAAEAAQAAQAAAAAAQAAATAAAVAQAHARAAVVTTTVSAPASGDAFASLRACEAGGDYTRNSGNGYFGAYQYSVGTWANYDGYARADLAPAAVQDAKAQADQATRGWSPWPGCAHKLGLM
jgi:hypothetical protein